MPTESKKPPAILLPPDHPKRRSWLALAAIVVCVAGLLWMTVVPLILPRRDALPTPAPTVVIALGAGALDDTTLTSTSSRRLKTATEYARAYNAGIVTTRTFGGSDSGAGAHRRAIVAAGLADRWTSLPNHINTTRDEALAMHMVISDTLQIAVVTSPLHTRRACAAFERVGYRVTCIASAGDEWWRTPYVVAYETAAYFKYKRAGWW